MNKNYIMSFIEKIKHIFNGLIKRKFTNILHDDVCFFINYALSYIKKLTL